METKLVPSGKEAIEWQHKVKAAIENSLSRLAVLESRIGGKREVIVKRVEK